MTLHPFRRRRGVTPSYTYEDHSELYEIAADNAAAWLECPCTRHAVFLGIGIGSVPGMSPALILHSVAGIIAEEHDTLPADVLRLSDLAADLWPTDATDTTD